MCTIHPEPRADHYFITPADSPGGRWDGRLHLKRKVNYSETTRKAPRKAARGYMERDGCGRGRKRIARDGGMVVERIVNGQYEWRDSGLRPMTGKRRRYYESVRGGHPNG